MDFGLLWRRWWNFHVMNQVYGGGGAGAGGAGAGAGAGGVG